MHHTAPHTAVGTPDRRLEKDQVTKRRSGAQRWRCRWCRVRCGDRHRHVCRPAGQTATASHGEHCLADHRPGFDGGVRRGGLFERVRRPDRGPDGAGVDLG